MTNLKSKKYDQAVEAVKVFRTMQYGLTSFARALTGRPDVSVVMSKSNGMTDGTTIYFRPPIILGKRSAHKRSLCDKRDDELQLLCPACAAREEVMATIYHEVAHIAFDSFMPVTEIGKLEAVKRIAREHKGKRGKKLVERLESAPFSERSSYIQLAGYINQFFPHIVNAVEDARVNAQMVASRSGVKVMLEAQLVRVFRDGIDVADKEERVFWNERPLNAQMTIGLYLDAGGYDYSEWLDPKVVEDLRSEKMQEVLSKSGELTDAQDVFNFCFDAMVAARELGYFEQEYDEPEEEEKDDDAEAEPGDSEGEQKDSGGDSGAPGGLGAPAGEPGESEGPGEEGSGGGSDESDGPEDADAGPESQPLDSESEDEGSGDEGGTDPVAPAGPDGDGSDDARGVDSGADTEGEVDEGPEAGHASGNDGEGEESEPERGNSDSDPEPGEGDLAIVDHGFEKASGYEGEPGDSSPRWGDDDRGDEDAESVPRNFGGAEGLAEDLAKILGHDHIEEGDSREEEALVEKAVQQSGDFDSPSHQIYGVTKVRHTDKQFDYSAWSNSHRTGGKVTVVETLIAKALLHARVAFSDNKRSKNVVNLKAGKINSRALGKRAFGDDPRLFKKKLRAAKKDYFVVLGMDVSGSSASPPTRSGRVSALNLEKRAVAAQAEILNRLGVPFAIFAHSGMYKRTEGSESQMTVDIFEVKSSKDPWNDKSKSDLFDLVPAAFNLDGHTMEFYRKQLDASTATDKILIYYTDGAMPNENYTEELAILQRELKTCKQKGYTVLAVGVGNNEPRKYGLDTVRVDSDADIVDVVKHIERTLAGV